MTRALAAAQPLTEPTSFANSRETRLDFLQEHTLALLARLDVLLRREAVRAQRERGARSDESYRGLYISDADVERLLGQPTPSEATDDGGLPDFDAVLRLADQRIRVLAGRCRTAGETPRLDRLAEVFGLSAFERDVVLICLAAEIDLKYERLFSYLQDDVTKKRPTVDLAMRLLGLSASQRAAARASFDADSPLLRWEIISIHDDPNARRPVLLARYAKLDDRITAYLLNSGTRDPRLGSPGPSAAHARFDYLDPGVRGRIDAWTAAWPWAAPEPMPVVLFHGRYGSGTSAAAACLAQALQRPLLLVDAAGGPEFDLGIARRMLLAEREALLSDAVLCWAGVDDFLNPSAGQESDSRVFLNGLARGSVATVLLADRAWEPGRLLARRPFLRLEVPDASYAEREAHWTAGLNGSSALQPHDVAALAGRFRLSPGQIDDAILRARSLAWSREPQRGQVSLDDIDAACRVQAQHRLGTLARKLVPRYTWDDIVLPSAQLTTLRLIATMIRQRPTVYGQWGFDRKLAMGKGVIALFAGPSGTGKTMAAEILARDLGLDLYRIDLSSVVNKYIGETEKNLERLFSEAQDSDAILFFDEADALFGKRSGVSDAHDRYANIETAYLLQRTEEYNGLVILASNLPRNMDDAFVRRIHFTVNFPPPEEAERLELWARTFPREAPRADDLDLEFLARQLKVTGGNIRNIILASAFLAADEQKPISMRHLVRASAYEFQKMGKMLLESDFGDYMDMAR